MIVCIELKILEGISIYDGVPSSTIPYVVMHVKCGIHTICKVEIGTNHQ